MARHADPRRLLALHHTLLGAMILLSTLASSGCRVTTWVWRGTFGEFSHATKAEELRAKGRFDEAEAEFRAHIAERLADKHRPAIENPFFYEILIGDMQLERGEVDKAIAAYLQAKEHNVDSALVVDRIRRVARWYEEHGKIDEAIALLKRHRELDDFIFDLEIDRLAKKLLGVG